MVELDLDSYMSRKVVTDQIIKYCIKNSDIYYLSAHDQEAVLFRLKGSSREKVLNFGLLDSPDTLPDFLLADDCIYILTIGFLFRFSFVDRSLTSLKINNVFEFHVHNNVLYFTEGTKNNLFQLDSELKKLQLNHYYSTHISFSGDQAYFANWTEDIGLYKTNLADGKSEKLVGGRISELCAGVNVVFYMSEENNYQLAKLKPAEHSKKLFKISPFEMVACGDRLYFSLYGRPGIYLLDEDNKISKIYDLYASSFSVDEGKLYFLTSTIASAADDWTELPF